MNQSVLIDIDQLRVGMFIQLDLGWMNHPFPMSSFRVSSQEQIHTLRELGLKQVRYVPAKSQPVPEVPARSGLQRDGAETAVPDPAGAFGTQEQSLDASAPFSGTRAWREQSESLQRCGQRYREATDTYVMVSTQVLVSPPDARRQVDALVGSCVAELLDAEHCAIRLLAEVPSERPALHAVNVMVLALLLGRALGLQSRELHHVGVAALLHDLGKIMLPPHVGEPGASLTPADLSRYEGHVGHSVELGQRMELASDVLIAIAQHHEMADGSGFPLRLMADDLGRGGQIVALANRYDRLCNPLHGAQALTPHEALSQIFAQQKMCFDATVLGAFIRMMGVYPPGSLVQLTDGRFALVVSVDALHPLRPCVLPFDAKVPRSQAVAMDLAAYPDEGIRRSLKPEQLPREALDYLSPQQRICYFFERAVDARRCEDGA